jgi:DNA-binding beta-propeller fold protein YncE
MKRLFTLFSTLVVCASSLLGATGEWQAFVSGQSQIPNAGSVVPIGLSSYTEGNVITVDEGANAIAITPDGKRALVANLYGYDVSVLDLTASPVSSYTVPLAAIGRPLNVAISPDGTLALVVCVAGKEAETTMEEAIVVRGGAVVVALDLTTTPVTPISNIYVIGIDSIAITPDGKKALVGFTEEVGGSFYPFAGTIGIIDLTTRPFSLSTSAIDGVFDGGISITPDGTRAVAVTQASNTATLIDLTATPNPQQLHSVTVGVNPTRVAITPDGKRAMVIFSGESGTDGGVTVLDLTKDSLSVETLSVPLGGAPGSIAISPDGKKAVVTKGSSNKKLADLSTSDVVFLDLTTSPVSILPTPDFIINGTTDVAISPDQAPTARFTFTHKKDTFLFDGSTSTSAVGEIATYAWDFGDGHKAVTTSPTVSHKYHSLSYKGKPILVTLTVTNTAGTSTEITFTGRTVSNNGGPSAVSVQPLIAPPASFVGKIHVDKKEALLKTHWTASAFEGVKRYEIFKNKKKVATVSADDHHKTIRLHPDSDVSLETLSREYRIRAVADDHADSPFTDLTLE